MKKVASFTDAYQAHILKGALEASGIPAYIQDEQLASIDWRCSQAIGGVKVNVPEEFYEEALQLVENIKKEQDVVNKLDSETGPLDICPKCGSKFLEPTSYSMWSLLPAILSGSPLFFGKKKWRCKKCGHKMK